MTTHEAQAREWLEERQRDKGDNNTTLILSEAYRNGAVAFARWQDEQAKNPPKHDCWGGKQICGASTSDTKGVVYCMFPERHGERHDWEAKPAEKCECPWKDWHDTGCPFDKPVEAQPEECKHMWKHISGGSEAVGSYKQYSCTKCGESKTEWYNLTPIKESK